MSRSLAPAGAESTPTLVERGLELLLRATQRLVHPFWDEPREIFERRWQRIFLRGPIGGVIGVWFGALATMEWGLPPARFPLLCGLAGVLLMSIAGHIESFIQTRTVSPSGQVQAGVAIGVDLVIGAGLGALMSFVLDAEAAALLATGGASLALIHYVASQIFWGDWVERTVFMLSGHVGGNRAPDYAHQADLAAQGHIDEALASYEQASAIPGATTAPLLLGAQLLRQEGRYEEAIGWYRLALHSPRVDPRRASVFVKHIVAVCRDHLGDSSVARPDLEALLEHFPDSVEVEWARDELQLEAPHINVAISGEGNGGKELNDPNTTLPNG